MSRAKTNIVEIKDNIEITRNLKINERICFKCFYYDPSCDECNNDDWCNSHCRFDSLPIKECKQFKARKECKHRIEDCSGCHPDCTVLCHHLPSNSEFCNFHFMCNLDDYICDENCDPHIKRNTLEKKKNLLSELDRSKKLIDNLIEENREDIKKLEIELKELNK